MAGKRVGKWARIFIDGYSLTAKISNVAPNNAFTEVEVSGYGQDKNYLAGQGDGTLVIDGFFDATANQTHDALKTLASGDNAQIVTVAYGNNAAPVAGDATITLRGNQMNYQTIPAKDGAIAVKATIRPAADYPIPEFGVLLDDATITQDGSSTAVNNGASSANGGVGYLHILGLSSGDSIVVKIQHSSDNNTYADLITFTLDGSAIGGERITVAGTVDQYLKATYDVTGASISFPLAVAFSRS